MVNKMEVVNYLKKIYGPKTSEREQKSLKGKLVDTHDWIVTLSICNLIWRMFFYLKLYVLDPENLANVIESLLDTVEENAASNDTSITSNFTEEIQSTVNNYCQEMSSTKNDLYHFKLFELWLFEILLLLPLEHF